MIYENQKWGYIEGIASIIINTTLFAFKLWAGMMIGSVAMIADAWHTLSDTMTSLIVIVGFWISGKPEDKDHPFGHGRAEVIGAVMIGVLLALVGFNFLKDSITHLLNRHTIQYNSLGVIIFTISIFVKEGIAQFSIWAGKKINSKALIADGWHHRSDAIASFLIVIGALLGNYFWWIDGVLGLIVSGLILYAAYDILKDGASVLMGECIDHEMEEKIVDIIKKIAPEVKDFHHIHLHRYGHHYEVTFHIKFPEHLTIKEAHDTVDQIENELRAKLNIESTIHFEPEEDSKKVDDYFKPENES